jgi:hypothetical protein
LLVATEVHAALTKLREKAEKQLTQTHLKPLQAPISVSLLLTPGLHVEMVTGMYDRHDQTLCETWAVLGTHPLGSPVDVYIKIGLHQNQVTLNLFSIHIDRTGELGAAIAAYQLKKSRK